MITIGHVRRHTGAEGVACYVGRRTRDYPGSALANPFRIGRDGDRAEVIAKYTVWLDEQLAEAGSAASLEMARIRAVWLERGDVTLLCWCHPLACHASVIKARMEAR